MTMPTIKKWMCPAHCDHITGIMSFANRSTRIRKLKNPEVIVPAIPRGHRNGGHIEVISESEDESGFYEENVFDRVYKLPESTIKLDFLEK